MARYTYVCEPIYDYCGDGCCCNFVRDSYTLKLKNEVIAEFSDKESMLLEILKLNDIKVIEEK